ncbi:AbrB family transcriptional regulator [Solibacillus sp. FSL H8-0538]|uniref:AbrB family transcriptional regulator n=1 Tax=Solibacillus sp. FSL H8-0538 TaxID=2921400 RepID=UPI0030FB5F27
MKKFVPIITVFFIALAGAFLFSWLSLPIPWMLGPLFAVLVSQFFVKWELHWPPLFRNAGLVVVGVAIGQAFDLALFDGLGLLVVLMVGVNVALMLFCVGLAWGMHRYSGISFKTALTASVPGGLSQLVLFAEEEADIDLAVVTFFHVVRIIAVVMLIPFLVSGHVVTGGEVAVDGTIWQLALLVAAAACSVWVGKRIRLPVAHFLTPILFVMLLHIVGVQTPVIPTSLLHEAQLLIGAYIGLLLKPPMLRLPMRVLVAGVASSFAMIVMAYLSSVVIAHFLELSFATSFLSTAPGGLDQMGLLATAVGADISVVTVFQLFRLLFIFLVVLPVLKYVCKKLLST